MQLQSLGHYRSSSSSAKNGKELRKADHVSDLFNHKPREEKEKKGAHVHLSYASRSLSEKLGNQIHQLVKQQPELGCALEKIPIPGEEELAPRVALQRKACAYIQWKKQNREKEPEDEVYIAVEKKDEKGAIPSLFEEIEDAKESLKEQRKQALPNYYYMVYPETYSFN